MKLIVPVAIVVSLTMPLFAGSVYFAAPGGTPGGDGSEGSPYDIVTACSKLGDNTYDEVRLLPGTYKMGSCTLSPIDYCAKLTGVGEAADVVLDGEGAGKTIDVQYGAQVRNITFTNYSATAVSSVLRVYTTDSYPTAVVANCVFTGVRGKLNACNLGGTGDILLVDSLFSDNESAPTYGCAVYAGNNPKTRIQHCTFVDNRYVGSSSQGGGAICSLGGITVDSCVISNNTASGYGGGLCILSGGGACVTNTLFYGNVSTDKGGGALHSVAGVDAPNRVMDCIFRANRISTKNVYGAGAQIAGEGMTVLKGCTFEDNVNEGENGFGAAVYGGSTTCEALIEECTFAGNRAVGKNGMGGACHFETYGDGIVIRDCAFTNNCCTAYGGAICARGPGALDRYLRLYVIDSLFVDNVATNSGGAFGQDYDGNARTGHVGVYTNCIFRGNMARQGGAFFGTGTTFVGCTFDSNRTDALGGTGAAGGAIFVNSRGVDRVCNPETTNHFVVVGCLFTNNVSSTYGMALQGQINTTYTITDSTFANNTSSSSSGSKNGGGGAVSLSVDVKEALLDRCVFRANSCYYYGGAFGIASTSTPKMESCTIRNSLFVANTNTTDYGGALYLNKNCTVVNCDFIANVGKGVSGAIHTGSSTGSSLVNCLFYGNRLTSRTGTADCDCYNTALRSQSTNCCSNISATFSDENDNIVVTDPKFVDAEDGDYRLCRGSPCVNKGVNQLWMAGARDLQNDRKIHRIEQSQVDIGCYELRPDLGLLLFVR